MNNSILLDLESNLGNFSPGKERQYNTNMLIENTIFLKKWNGSYKDQSLKKYAVILEEIGKEKLKFPQIDIKSLIENFKLNIEGLIH